MDEPVVRAGRSDAMATATGTIAVLDHAIPIDELYARVPMTST